MANTKKLKWQSGAEVGELFHAMGERVRHIIVKGDSAGRPIKLLQHLLDDAGDPISPIRKIGPREFEAVPNVMWYYTVGSVDEAKALADEMEEGHKPGPACVQDPRADGGLFKPERA